jgi:hypothetical protein
MMLMNYGKTSKGGWMVLLFQDIWKDKHNIENKDTKENYKPVSFLSVASKMMEKVVCDLVP